MSKSNPTSFKERMKRLRKSKLYPYISNRFVLTAAGFLFWMVCFDDNSVYQQLQRRYRIYEQNQKIHYYQSEIAEVEKERDALFGNTATLERFARERYKMVGEGEDLYLVIEK